MKEKKAFFDIFSLHFHYGGMFEIVKGGSSVSWKPVNMSSSQNGKGSIIITIVIILSPSM